MGVRRRWGRSSSGCTQPARRWPLRATDFDTAGHVNNSVHWAAVEDVLAGLAPGWLPASAELEYARPILPGHDPDLVTEHAPDHLAAWLRSGAQPLASARLTR